MQGYFRGPTCHPARAKRVSRSAVAGLRLASGAAMVDPDSRSLVRDDRLLRPLTILLVSLLIGAAACGKDAATPASAAAQSGTTPKAGASGTAGNRPVPSITLAATDVATIAPGTIEDGTA